MKWLIFPCYISETEFRYTYHTGKPDIVCLPGCVLIYFKYLFHCLLCLHLPFWLPLFILNQKFTRTLVYTLSGNLFSNPSQQAGNADSLVFGGQQQSFPILVGTLICPEPALFFFWIIFHRMTCYRLGVIYVFTCQYPPSKLEHKFMKAGGFVLDVSLEFRAVLLCRDCSWKDE